MEKLHPVGNTVLFENERVRVWQVDLGSGEELSLHQHEVPYLVMHQTDGHLGVAYSDGSRGTSRGTRSSGTRWVGRTR
jgi:hypothetical protein